MLYDVITIAGQIHMFTVVWNLLIQVSAKLFRSGLIRGKYYGSVRGQAIEFTIFRSGLGRGKRE